MKNIIPECIAGDVERDGQNGKRSPFNSFTLSRTFRHDESKMYEMVVCFNVTWVVIGLCLGPEVGNS